MSESSSQPLHSTSQQPDPRVAPVKRAVKTLAVFVMLSLATAAVLALINVVTDRPAKEVFLGPGPDPVLVDSPFAK